MPAEAEHLAERLAALLELPSRMAEVEARLAEVRAAVEAVQTKLPPALATSAQAAQALGVSVATVRRRVRDGQLPTVRVGRALRIDLSALRAREEADVARLASHARLGLVGEKPSR